MVPKAALSSFQMNFCVTVQPVPPNSSGQLGATQPFRVQDFVPRQKIFFAQIATVHTDQMLGVIIFNKAAHFGAEGFIFRVQNSRP